MENSADKQRWIEDVMQSANGISRAQPHADLYERITAKINTPGAGKTVALPVARWVAAAILLLALNIGSALHFSAQHRNNTTHNNMPNPFAAAMQTETTYNY